MFLQELEQTAYEKCGLDKELPILIGVSGGGDSLALLEGLHTLGFNLIVGHLDHALRAESQQEADYVRDLAANKDILFTSQRVDVLKFAQSESQSVEEAARNVRYQFLFEQARKYRCQAVAVGHHADDQVETLLMHLLRGAALPGLTGMPFSRILPQWDLKIPLVRPLLTIWKEDIDAYVLSVGLEPCEDRTNLDLKYLRNKIRHELIPILMDFNPKIKTVLLQTVEILQDEENYLDELAKNAYYECTQMQSDECILINKNKFDLLSIALKRRVLRLMIEQLRPGLRDVGFETIKRGLECIASGKSGRRTDLVAKLELVFLDEEVLICSQGADLPDLGYPLLPEENYSAVLAPEESIHIRYGKIIYAGQVDELPENWLAELKNLEPDEVWLDFDRLKMPLTIRTRREGDRFKPLGMGGRSQSLQDVFINLKIPAQVRALWGLITSGEEIVWVMGLRQSEDTKITAQTTKVLKLKILASELN